MRYDFTNQPTFHVTSMTSLSDSTHIPSVGEIIIATDDRVGIVSMRVGDGIHRFSECPEIYMSDIVKFQNEIMSIGEAAYLRTPTFEDEVIDDVGDIL